MKKQILLIGSVVAIVIGISFTLLPINIQGTLSQFATSNYDDVPRAAVIDQLYDEYPDEDLHNTVTEYLKNAGYKVVDIYKTEEITVDFYKNLPSMNYKFILIRSHALGAKSMEASASLFTGEKYNNHKYVKEQFLSQVHKGVPYLDDEIQELGGWKILEDNTYFLVGSNLFDSSMIGEFPGSTIILAGCATMKDNVLADSFLKRGASEVVGWSNLVGPENNDEVIIHLLNQTLNNDVKMKNAVQSLTNLIEGKLDYGATVVYYSTGDNEITDDIKVPSKVKGPSGDTPSLWVTIVGRIQVFISNLD